jgi:hypothetical protein
MVSLISASADIEVAEAFRSANPQPVPEAEARVVSEKTNDLTGFFADQDRVSITPEAQAKSVADQNIKSSESADPPAESSNEFIQVSSSIGRAASSGNMRREEAMAIYQKIAALI